MLLDVSRALRNPGEAIPFTHHEQIAPQDINGETVTFDDPVELEGTYTMSGSDLTLEGVLTATAHSRCCNCLSPAQVSLSVPFREIFTRLDRFQEEKEDDPDRWVFSGSKAELSHLALTLALLDLPIRILCRPDCDGYKQLAPQYTVPQKSNPFSVLENLLKNDQNDQEV